MPHCRCCRKSVKRAYVEYEDEYGKHVICHKCLISKNLYQKFLSKFLEGPFDEDLVVFPDEKHCDLRLQQRLDPQGIDKFYVKELLFYHTTKRFQDGKNSDEYIIHYENPNDEDKDICIVILVDKNKIFLKTTYLID